MHALIEPPPEEPRTRGTAYALCPWHPIVGHGSVDLITIIVSMQQVAARAFISVLFMFSTLATAITRRLQLIAAGRLHHQADPVRR